MDIFPNFKQPLFHVPSQRPCISLGGCLTSKLVTAKFNNGMVLSIRLAELIPNELTNCAHCGNPVKPDQKGVCKKCRTPLCPSCGKCNC
ncbi:hypothetical protein [Desulforamulus reducens]|nr:hypothetical protein [Desulforamulus reducens]